MKSRLLLAGLVGVLLIALVSCSRSTATSSGSVTVQVTLTDFKIQSSLTTFKVGVPYHFVVTNNGPAVHEIMAGPIAKATASEDERDAAKLFEVSELETGKSGTADYTFTQPYPAGVMEFACHVPGHYESGMRLDFTVTA
jgi:uncharacterized cupredoxin-like copper-binding protein